mmetsp:Transcript_31260/g.70734  ORF Transcript_31260/g.70734 Transcript_31260/m.70734 type:complete len:222 (+) Transcript_31260:3689-4354(+)
MAEMLFLASNGNMLKFCSRPVIRSSVANALNVETAMVGDQFRLILPVVDAACVDADLSSYRSVLILSRRDVRSRRCTFKLSHAPPILSTAPSAPAAAFSAAKSSATPSTSVGTSEQDSIVGVFKLSETEAFPELGGDFGFGPSFLSQPKARLSGISSRGLLKSRVPNARVWKSTKGWFNVQRLDSRTGSVSGAPPVLPFRIRMYNSLRLPRSSPRRRRKEE